LEALHADFNAYYEKLYGKTEDDIEVPDSNDLIKAMKSFNEVSRETPKPSKAKTPPKAKKLPQKPKVVKKFINQKNNPFKILGVYEEPSSHILDPHYNDVHFGIQNNNDYCKLVDMVNLKGPGHLYSSKGFVFTDFSKNSKKLMCNCWNNILGLVHDAISNFSQNVISKGDIDGYIQNYKVTKVRSFEKNPI